MARHRAIAGAKVDDTGIVRQFTDQHLPKGGKAILTIIRGRTHPGIDTA
nr:hypothetical protein [Eilatimonas milleporae]